MQMRLSSSRAAVVRKPCRPQQRACQVAVRRAQAVERRDVRAAFFKIGGKSGEAEAYGTASVSVWIVWNDGTTMG